MVCKRDVRRKLLCKSCNQVLKISTYQLSRSVKIMVTQEKLVFGHRLEGLLIHVDGERDGILLCTSLGGSIGVAATFDGAFSPISLTFGGPLARVPFSRDALASLGAQSGESIEIIAQSF